MPALRDKTIAIVGGGTMGSAIALGLVRTGSLEPQRVLVADPCQDRRDHLASEGIQVFDAASSMGATSPDVVIIAVKPQVLPDVVKKASDLLGGRLVISIAAGVKLQALESLMPASRIIRVMPNLPIWAVSGATAVCAGSAATREDVGLASALFGCLGCTLVMREDQLDVEGAVVSCGPAYIALFADLLVRAGVEHGLPAAGCREMVLSTMRGVAGQLLESGEHPRAYMERVTSPGGTTAAGLRAMEPSLMLAVEEGIDAALARTAELGQAKGE